MSVKKKNAGILTADCEELDYEEDEINSSKNNSATLIKESSDKKSCSVTLEKDDDAEEGEILDADDNDCNQKRVCKFFQHGECSFRDKCPNLHITDKGLYRMFDPFPIVSHKVPDPFDVNPSFVPVCPAVNSSRLDNDELSETALTDWDRALIEAKKLVKQWDNVVRPSNPIVIDIERDNEQVSRKLSKKPRRYKSPSPEVLPPNTSRTNSFSISPEQKLADIKNKWHDPWRRSPIRCAEPVKSFSRFSRKNSSSKSPVPDCSSKSSPHPRRKLLFISDRRPPETTKNRHRSFSRRLSSSSSSPDTLHHSRKDKLKKGTKLSSSKQDQQHWETAKNLHKAIPRPSLSTVSSPPSVPSSRKEQLRSEGEMKLQSSIKEKKTSHTVENKTDKYIKPSTLKRQCHEFNENRSKTNSHRSLNTNSPPSLDRSKKERSNAKTKLQSSNQKKKTVSAAENKLERNLKPNESVKKGSTNRQSNDVSQWTPKKVKPVTSPAQSCSDMSISPLTDSSLSDLFDPDKMTKWMNRLCQHETNRSHSFQPRKKCQAEVYGPVCLPKSQPVAPSMSVTKSKTSQNSEFANLTGVRSKEILNSSNCIMKNKNGDLSKYYQMKKRNFSALEADLLKFQRGSRFVDSEPTLSKNIQKTKLNQTPKKDGQSQKMMQTTKENDIQRGGPLIQNKSSYSRKEKILKQLEAIDAAIEKKKNMYLREFYNVDK